MIGQYIDTHNGLCKVYPSPFAVFLNADDKNYVEPDISVICDKNKLDDRGCNGAPDWVIEIASPSNPSHDYITKLNLYNSAGVREYWIVEPINETVYVYDMDGGELPLKTYSFRDAIKVGIYEDLSINFSSFDLGDAAP